jgi:hypothetical protein
VDCGRRRKNGGGFLALLLGHAGDAEGVSGVCGGVVASKKVSCDALAVLWRRAVKSERGATRGVYHPLVGS